MGRMNDSTEFDDDVNWQEQEDLDEDESFEQMGIELDTSDVYYGA